MTRSSLITLFLAVVLGLLPRLSLARSEAVEDMRLRTQTAASVRYCNAVHDVGQVEITIGNTGILGTGFALGNFADCFTGEYLPSCRYPHGSNTSYLWSAALWVGAVIGEDTLVSTSGAGFPYYGGYEFHPTALSGPGLTYRSATDPTSPAYPGAVSEQDYVAVMADTCLTCTGLGLDPETNRPHHPLNVEVVQKSYAWSYRETEDFILIDYLLTNIGSDHLTRLYVGWYADCDIFSSDIDPSLGYADDISGFVDRVVSPWTPEGCRYDADIRAAWSADNDGDFYGQVPVPSSPAVFALMPLGFPESSKLSFNWWFHDYYSPVDFGPQSRAAFRFLYPGELGTPQGDRDKYHILNNGEIDYDQIRMATISGDDSVWLPPPVSLYRLAAGMDTRFVISRGPFDLLPGESCRFALAVVMGDKFHRLPNSVSFLPRDPDGYMSRVSFDDLAANALVAQYVYDNPGVDSDNDGYAGESILCGDDTVWVKGDGVPDWRASITPTAPICWVEPLFEGFRIRWNGVTCETQKHWLSHRPTFEGYHLYLGTDSTAANMALIGSYDLDDYNRFRWDSQVSDWVLADVGIVIEDLICRYAPQGCSDHKWRPSDYTRQSPYLMPGFSDSVFYFEPLGPNASRFGVETPFAKPYPAAPRPAYTSPEQVPSDSAAFYLTNDGFLKYYEYEMTVRELVPRQKYWLAVTAFDKGSLLPLAVPLESPVLAAAVGAVTLQSDPGCCHGQVGNVNCDQSERVDIGDVMTAVDYLFQGGPALCCPAEADIDQSGGRGPGREDITIGDILRIVDYLFISYRPLPECL
ncbi:MAG: hypothetical protein NTW07_13165 [candidate division Zixibacteria bacterium]|nr:hypothetical protein [candidate division Zixibacteria bacterium]